jgi:hypothetical protein
MNRDNIISLYPKVEQNMCNQLIKIKLEKIIIKKIDHNVYNVM